MSRNEFRTRELLRAKELVEALHKETGIPKPFIGPLLRDFYSVMEEAFASEEDIRVPWLFYSTLKDHHSNVNPSNPSDRTPWSTKVRVTRMSKTLYSLWNGSVHFSDREKNNFPKGWSKRFKKTKLFRYQKDGGAPLDF